MLASSFMLLGIRMRWASSCLSMSTLAACGTINQGPSPAPPRLSPQAVQVSDWMRGSFSNRAQALAHPQDFRHVILHMATIWPERSGESWLYVEQAMADSPSKPYRQRVYRVLDAEGGVESMVFELPGDPLRYAGAWQDPARLNDLLPEMLVPRDGCSVTLRREGEAWAGGTRPGACESSLRGAATAQSQVWLRADEIRTLDQGFDAQGKQVWGSTAGAYVFTKESPR